MKKAFDHLISIAIPAYKSIFLEETIASILAQEYQNFELIILNDCSPNPIEDVVMKYSSDARVKYYKNSVNVGAEKVVDNWNKCLSIADGEFFVMMGDDDRMAPNFLSEFIKLIMEYPSLDVYHCRTLVIDESSEPLFLTPILPKFESVYDNILGRITMKRVQFISDFFYRTKELKKNGGFFYLPLAWASDDITSYIACGQKGIAHTNVPVFNYRKNRYSISSSGDSLLKMKALMLELEWINNFLVSNIPVYDNDKILRKNILEALPDYIKLRRRHIIYTSLKSGGGIKNLWIWISNRVLFRLSTSDILVSLLKYIYNI